jgi:predicted DNA-binding transcriptional regulator AlpA
MLALMSHHLVGVKEIADMLGVTSARVVQLASAYEDFPLPEVVLASGRVWKRTAIERWMRDHPARRPGRPARR